MGQARWQHWACRSSCFGAALPAGFLRLSQDRSLKSVISKSTDISENLGSLYIPTMLQWLCSLELPYHSVLLQEPRHVLLGSGIVESCQIQPQDTAGKLHLTLSPPPQVASPKKRRILSVCPMLTDKNLKKSPDQSFFFSAGLQSQYNHVVWTTNLTLNKLRYNQQHSDDGSAFPTRGWTIITTNSPTFLGELCNHCLSFTSLLTLHRECGLKWVKPCLYLLMATGETEGTSQLFYLHVYTPWPIQTRLQDPWLPNPPKAAFIGPAGESPETVPAAV